MFVTGLVQGRRGKSHFETAAYRAATGARLWASSYQRGGYGYPAAMTVSPDGARVYLTAGFIGRGDGGIVAYNARTGRQLWTSRYLPDGLRGGEVGGLAVSPDGTTLYVAGNVSLGSHLEFAVIAYDAATGKQRWLRDDTKVPGKAYNPTVHGNAESVAVSPDGKTVYATGFARSSALTIAYGAAGTVKWAARYQDPYGFAAGFQIVAGPGGGAVYVVGKAANKNGHFDAATFAYRAATGRCMWLDRYPARIQTAPDIAVTPGGQVVIVTVPLNHGTSYAVAAYDAGTGRTRWTRLAPDTYVHPSGLVINPRGDTMFIGGNRTAAYSVADGTVLWMSGYNRNFPVGVPMPGIIGLSHDGTRLFATRQTKRGITWSIAIIAYRT